MKSILMTVQVTRVSMESVWMALIVTAVSAHQDSQVMLLFVGTFFLFGFFKSVAENIRGNCVIYS